MKLIVINSVFALLSISCSDKKTADVNFQPKPFSAADAEADFKKGNCRMITYGLPAVDERYLYEDSLAKVYGFYYDNQGCDVYDSSLIGADMYNFRMEILLQKKNGKSWKKDFDWKIDSLVHQYELRHRNDTE